MATQGIQGHHMIPEAIGRDLSNPKIIYLALRPDTSVAGISGSVRFHTSSRKLSRA